MYTLLFQQIYFNESMEVLMMYQSSYYHIMFAIHLFLFELHYLYTLDLFLCDCNTVNLLQNLKRLFLEMD
jgi:hypothetical protein